MVILFDLLKRNYILKKIKCKNGSGLLQSTVAALEGIIRPLSNGKQFLNKTSSIFSALTH